MELTFVLLFSLTFSGFVTATEYYSDVYDNVDVDSIFKSDRLFKQYLDCILEDGSCTADARNLKRILPEVVATNCEKCTPAQRQLARKMAVHLKGQRPDVWKIFVEKFDPTRKYRISFEEFLMQEY